MTLIIENKNPSITKLLWIDMEMTGLDDKTDSILEVAAIVTDWELNPIEEMSCVVFQPPEVIKSMNAWCQTTHAKTGLKDQVPQGLPLPQVEEKLLALVAKHFDPKTPIVIAGNSIGNDRRFIDRCLPQFAQKLHYRMLDVSSFKEVFRNKYGIEIKKKNTHRASQDISESILELKAYLNYIAIPKEPSKS